MLRRFKRLRSDNAIRAVRRSASERRAGGRVEVVSFGQIAERDAEAELVGDVIHGWNGADLQSLEEESVLDFSSSLRMYRDNQPDRIGRYDVHGRRYLLDLTCRF